MEIRNEVNPLFPGINPEPILPHIHETQLAVVAEKCDAGLITDGDADRIGAVDEHGNVVDAHKVFSILMYWLLDRKKWPGEVTRAFNTTKMIDRIAAKYGRKLNEHGLGFKYVCDLMLEKEILCGGVESGGIGISRHLPERDGRAELSAAGECDGGCKWKKTLGELVRRAAGGVWRAPVWARGYTHIDEVLKQSAIARAKAGVKDFAGLKVLRVETLDGIKFFLENPACATKANAAGDAWRCCCCGLRGILEPLLSGLLRELFNGGRSPGVLEAAQQFVLQGSAV